MHHFNISTKDRIRANTFHGGWHDMHHFHLRINKKNLGNLQKFLNKDGLALSNVLTTTSDNESTKQKQMMNLKGYIGDLTALVVLLNPEIRDKFGINLNIFINYTKFKHTGLYYDGVFFLFHDGESKVCSMYSIKSKNFREKKPIYDAAEIAHEPILEERFEDVFLIMDTTEKQDFITLTHDIDMTYSFKAVYLSNTIRNYPNTIKTQNSEVEIRDVLYVMVSKHKEMPSYGMTYHEPDYDYKKKILELIKQ